MLLLPLERLICLVTPSVPSTAKVALEPEKIAAVALAVARLVGLPVASRVDESRALVAVVPTWRS